MRPEHETSTPGQPAFQHSDNVVLHPAVLRPTGPLAEAPQASFDEPEAADVIPAAPQPPAEPTMRVEAVRETITYSVPVSEATLPPHLLRAGQRLATVAEVPVPRTVALESGRLPPPLPPSAPELEAASASQQAPVIALPDATAAQAVRADHSSPYRDTANSWQFEPHGHLVPDLPLDDTRSIALRLRPDTGAIDGR